MKYTPVGIDIAKHLMQVHFIDEHTGEVIDRQIKRDALLEYFSNREPCLIGMEACGGAQYWARELEKLGHRVKLLQHEFRNLQKRSINLKTKKLGCSYFVRLSMH